MNPAVKLVMLKSTPVEGSFGKPKQHYENATIGLGSYGANGAIGLPFDRGTKEYTTLLPKVLGINPNADDVDEKINTYFSTIIEEVPTPGIRFTIPLEDVTLETMENYSNAVLKDYVLIKFHERNPLVAPNKKTAMSNKDRYPFYIEDLNIAKKETQKIESRELEAFAKVASYFIVHKSEDLNKNNSRTLRHIITLLGGNLRTLRTIEDQKSFLLNYIKLKEILFEGETTTGINAFLKVTQDKLLTEKALIISGVESGVIKRVGNVYQTGINFDINLGYSMEEAITWLQNPVNNVQKSGMIKQIKEANK